MDRTSDFRSFRAKRIRSTTSVRGSKALSFISLDFHIVKTAISTTVRSSEFISALDFEPLSKIGLTQYERQALIALLKRGVADAATICEDGDVPSSKIYSATEKLARIGLIEVQRSRPRQFAAMSVDAVLKRVAEIAQEQAERFSRESQTLKDLIEAAHGASKPASAFADVALGTRQHLQRHVSLIGAAESEVVSYLELPDIDAFYMARESGLNPLRLARKNFEARGAKHRIVFGFGPRDASRLITFLGDFANDLRAATTVRYSGLLGHPFHVIDGATVILSLDNPFLPERRFGSVLMRSKELAEPLVNGFEELWSKSMRSLKEVPFDPRLWQGR
jgi:hypothetical protein